MTSRTEDRDSAGKLQNTVEGALGLKLSTLPLKVMVDNILKTCQTFERRIPRRLNINYAHYWSDGRIKFKKCWPFCEKRKTEWGIIKIIIVEGCNVGHKTVLSCMSKLTYCESKYKQIKVDSHDLRSSCNYRWIIPVKAAVILKSLQ